MPNIQLPALIVNQWLPGWDEFKYDEGEHDAKPKPYFILFTLPANILLRISGIYTRSENRVTGIQRGHDETRSEVISRYVRYGYPACDNPANKESSFFKPGWLPTSIVVNIINPGEKRNGLALKKEYAINVVIDEEKKSAFVEIPEAIQELDQYTDSIPPIEIMDGQHRLLAFSHLQDAGENYYLPVVASIGLDISWQAYIFYTVNISPKKINKSLAYDLYPLLRNQDWLKNTTSNDTYRTTRAQEIVNSLYSLALSPWNKTINMLGERNQPGVSQAAWINSLKATFLANNSNALYSDMDQETNLSWPRSLQIAYIIFLGKFFYEKYETEYGNSQKNPLYIKDIFRHKTSLLAQDQGTRALLHVFNKISKTNIGILNDFNILQSDKIVDDMNDNYIETLVNRFRSTVNLIDRIDPIISSLATYDWRSSTANIEDELEALKKKTFRGSTGYKSIREDVMAHCKLPFNS